MKDGSYVTEIELHIPKKKMSRDNSKLINPTKLSHKVIQESCWLNSLSVCVCVCVCVCEFQVVVDKITIKVPRHNDCKPHYHTSE